MRFLIADNDASVRSLLAEIIEDHDFGEVVEEMAAGILMDSNLLSLKNIDILIADIPVEGVQKVMNSTSSFKGKIIVVSKETGKETPGLHYAAGVEYHVSKPVDRLEIAGVVKRVMEHLSLEKSIHDIQQILSTLDLATHKNAPFQNLAGKSIVASGEFLLAELGMMGESGCTDLLDMLEFMFQYENQMHSLKEFPPLKDIFTKIAENRLGPSVAPAELNKEAKASEQRVRRAILQALKHLASLGLTDYSNPKFEEHATKFFDFSEVRKKMLELENNLPHSSSSVRINTKRFIKVLYVESKKRM